MNQHEIVKKIEDFIEKEFDTKAKIDIEPKDIIAVAGNKVMKIGHRINITFEVD